jgi:hypothetical protein
MLYIGHFSFDEIGSAQEIRHGYFTSVVDTDNVDRAVNEFKELILSMRKIDDTFRQIIAIYIEDIVEFHHVPSNGVVTRIQSSDGKFPESITRNLPGVVAPGIKIYGFAPAVQTAEGMQKTDEYKESRVFIKF